MAAAPALDRQVQSKETSHVSNISGDLHRIASAIESLPQALPVDRGCYQGRDNRESELCAQWKAADAAAEAARWAWWTMLASCVGVVIGGGTLVAAFLAARWAKTAAIETRRGSRAAEEAVRCHILIGDASISFGEKDQAAKVRAEIRNEGDTPARKVKMVVRLQLSRAFKYGEGDNDWAFGSDHTRTSPWTPWHEVDIGCLLPARGRQLMEELIGNFWLTEEERAEDAWLRGGVQIKVSFIDIFGNKSQRLEYRDIGEIRPLNVRHVYPLNVDFGGGETIEWPCDGLDEYQKMMQAAR